MGAVAQKRLFLIDAFGFIFRAYHARARSGAPPMRTSTGLSTEAVYIFNNMLRKLAKEHKPPYIAAVFESGEPTHRVQEFAEYKANRAEMPPDLGEQIPYVRRVLDAMRIPILEYPGFEADDVIGTIARRAEAAGFEVVIVSSDKDMLQLVTGRVAMLNPAKDDAWYDPPKVKEFMGVEPGQVTDLLALMGDARRAGNRREGRAGIDWKIRVGGGGHRARRGSAAQDAPRKPAEQRGADRNE
jgi:DNA polymerase-1